MTTMVRKLTPFMAMVALAFAFFVQPSPADAQVTAFKQAVAEAAARDKDIAAFYQATDIIRLLKAVKRSMEHLLNLFKSLQPHKITRCIKQGVRF